MSCQTLRSSFYRESESERDGGGGDESPVREHMVRSAIARRGFRDGGRAPGPGPGPAIARDHNHNHSSRRNRQVDAQPQPQHQHQPHAQRRRRHSSVMQQSVSSSRSDRSRDASAEPQPRTRDEKSLENFRAERTSAKRTNGITSGAGGGDARSGRWRTKRGTAAAQPSNKALDDDDEFNADVLEKGGETRSQKSTGKSTAATPAPRFPPICTHTRGDEEEEEEDDERHSCAAFVRSHSSPKSRRNRRSSEHHVGGFDVGASQDVRDRSSSVSISTSTLSKSHRHSDYREKVEEEEEFDDDDHQRREVLASRTSSRPVSLYSGHKRRTPSRTPSPTGGVSGPHAAAAEVISREDLERSLHVLTQLVDQLRVDNQNGALN